MDKKKKFGLFLTKLREQQGLNTQRKLAILSKISPATISRIEAGIQQAEPETLKKLAPHLKIPYEDLMEAAGYIKKKNDNPLDKEPDIRLISRRAKQMTPEQRERWIKAAELLFPEMFNKGNDDSNDTNETT